MTASSIADTSTSTGTGTDVTGRLSTRVRQVPASGIRKFFDILASMDDVISLGVGEPDFVTPPHIVQAGVDSLDKGETHYTSNYGLIELREAVAGYLNDHYGAAYDPKTEVLITAGVSEAVDIALRAVIDPGDEVIVPEPAYVSYRPCITFAGGEPVGIDSSAATNFRITAAQIAAAITPRTKALLLGFPANPTGAMLPRAEWEQIVDLARQHNLIMLSDEIYGRLAYTMEHTCVSALPGAWDRTILLGGFSKSYAMTGWRIGYVAAPSAILEYIMKVHQYVLMCAPTMSQYAALQAVRHGEPDVARMLDEYTKRRTLIVDGLNAMGLDCVEPDGAFYCFPSIRSTGLSSQAFAERLLQEEHVACVAGDAFGPCGDGHVRMCYAVPTADIEVALERIESFVNRVSA